MLCYAMLVMMTSGHLQQPLNGCNGTFGSVPFSACAILTPLLLVVCALLAELTFVSPVNMVHIGHLIR
jgi:hypothetical protein